MIRGVATLGLVFCATAAAAQYVPPNGIPSPAFGVNETAPAPTLYVDAATGNDSNPGTIGSKKATIPRTLSAGTVVQVSGTQTFNYISPNGFHVSGSSGSPVWIVSNPAIPMIFTQTPEIDGTYAIIEGGSGVGWTVQDTAAGGNTDHLVFRTGNHTGGFFVFSAHGGVVSQIVLKAMTVHDYGEMHGGEAGGDHHCVTINGADHVWVLDSLFYACSGDGVQINATSEARGALTHHIYLGRNICAGNRQTCLWSKWSENAVMSQNVATNMRSIEEPTSPGTYLNPGACYGAQYGAKTLVIMQNLCLLSDWGIRIAAYTIPAGHGTGVSIIGNTITRIHSSIGNGGQPDYGGSGGHAIAITDQGGGPMLVANNTIYDVDEGFGSVPAGGAITYLNNILMQTGHHDVTWDTDAPTLSFNNFDNTAILHPSTTNSNPVIGDPLFTNAPSLEFTLRPGSPALHAGFGFDANSGYLAIHGVATGLDLSGTPNIGASQADPATPMSRPVVRLRMK